LLLNFIFPNKFRYIPPEQVPVQFGGLYKEDDPEFTTSDAVTDLTIKASSKETIEIPATEVGCPLCACVYVSLLYRNVCSA
jgi:hypothetical protein